ncbi:hypothetical protein LTR16_003481 [Cryomyces antarcticus]|uniref:EXPERA domain-containing protein n=1 Tax=Cryomyces antarcticus TaxID=329879 RepID=A0ABR0M703_9PEZI|nr:hypothetical protein LTR16_003481 [Cryomyces antarcticus]
MWLLISLPLVFWDTGYVMLRPHSMPGGKYHSPVWVPYALYGTIDYIYGWPAYNAHNGFTAAQGTVNIIESIGYIVYLWIVYTYGKQANVKGRGAPSRVTAGWLAEGRIISGRMGAWAVLIGFGTALMTVSKTALYWLNEYFSGFENIGHNDPFTLFFMWIIPNGAWLVLPSYMMYVFGQEILQGLEAAVGEPKKQR